MSATVFPVPDAAERRDNASFEALMWAMARPGTERLLPEAGLLPVALALVDIETRVFCDDLGLIEPLTRTGTSFVALEEADHLVLAGGLSASVVAAVSKGSMLYPDDGATIIAALPLTGGPRLRLTGPGIDGAIEIAPSLPADIWEARARAPYPTGFELILVEGRRVVCLPRSTIVEVL